MHTDAFVHSRYTMKRYITKILISNYNLIIYNSHKRFDNVRNYQKYCLLHLLLFELREPMLQLDTEDYLVNKKLGYC